MWICPICKMKNDSMFCVTCGAKKPENRFNTAPIPPIPPVPPRPPVTPVTPQPKNSNGWIIAVVAIICLTILGLVAVLNNKEKTASRRNGNDAITPTPSAVATASPTPAATIEKKKIYNVVKSNESWESANQSARNAGKSLITINSSEEFNKAITLAQQANLTVFWVGAKLAGHELWSNAYWQTGEPLSGLKWFPGEPSYIEDGNEERYLMVFKVEGVWYFNDAENDVSRYYKDRMGYITEGEQ